MLSNYVQKIKFLRTESDIILLPRGQISSGQIVTKNIATHQPNLFLKANSEMIFLKTNETLRDDVDVIFRSELAARC